MYWTVILLDRKAKLLVVNAVYVSGNWFVLCKGVLQR